MLGFILSVVLGVLKVTGYITISWLLVVLPVVILPVITVMLVTLFAIVGAYLSKK